MRDPKIFSPAIALAKMSRVELGALAEDFVYYQLRRRGLDVYRPSYSKQSIDFVVIGAVTGRVVRCQVKSTTLANLEVRLRHTVYENGQYLRRDYVRGIVDCFFAVDLLHEHVFVIPDGEIGTKSAFKLTPQSWAWQFKDRYDLLDQ